MVRAARNASGYVLDTNLGTHEASVGFNFQGWYSHIAAASPYVLGYTLRATALALLGMASIVLLRRRPQQETRLEFLAAAAELRDLDAALVPVHGTHELEFCVPVLSPRIRIVEQQIQKVAAEHDRLRPGSEAAREYLASIAEECRKLTAKLLIPEASRSLYSISFAAGGGRAIEIALAKFGLDAVVIISPFERPGILGVASWRAKISNQEISVVVLDPEELFGSWNRQQTCILGALSPIAKSGRPMVLVISEVMYSTGQVVPVDVLVASIRETFPDCVLKVIVDGSQSIGNVGYSKHSEVGVGGPRYLSVADVYVFSVHKWLMSPEPCGVLLSRDRDTSSGAYDEWADRNPRSTPSPEMIAALRGSLQLVQTVGLETLVRRSALLQKRFLEGLSVARLQHVRSVPLPGKTEMTRTAISVVKPAPGYCWKPSFQQILRARSVSVFIPDDFSQQRWLSVGFPYFTSLWHVDRLLDALRECVEIDA